MTCIEKNITYETKHYAPHSPRMTVLNPMGQAPALKHEKLLLQETDAICRYINEAFAGKRLQPEDLAERTQMNLWMSAICDRVYRTMIRDIVLPHAGFVEKSAAKLEQAVMPLTRRLKRIDARLRDHVYLAGDSLTFADLFLAPIIFWLKVPPEGQAHLPTHDALNRWYDETANRPSFALTLPSITG